MPPSTRLIRRIRTRTRRPSSRSGTPSRKRKNSPPARSRPPAWPPPARAIRIALVNHMQVLPVTRPKSPRFRLPFRSNLDSIRFTFPSPPIAPRATPRRSRTSPRARRAHRARRPTLTVVAAVQLREKPRRGDCTRLGLLSFVRMVMFHRRCIIIRPIVWLLLDYLLFGMPFRSNILIQHRLHRNHIPHPLLTCCL